MTVVRLPHIALTLRRSQRWDNGDIKELTFQRLYRQPITEMGLDLRTSSLELRLFVM